MFRARFHPSTPHRPYSRPIGGGPYPSLRPGCTSLSCPAASFFSRGSSSNFLAPLELYRQFFCRRNHEMEERRRRLTSLAGGGGGHSKGRPRPGSVCGGVSHSGGHTSTSPLSDSFPTRPTMWLGRTPSPCPQHPLDAPSRGARRGSPWTCQRRRHGMCLAGAHGACRGQAMRPATRSKV